MASGTIKAVASKADIDALNSKMAKHTGSFTSENITVQGEMFVVKFGNVVICQLAFKPTTDIAAWTTFCTIPSGYRPAKTVFAADIYGIGFYQINTDGTVMQSVTMPNASQRRSNVSAWYVD